jgi:hypothetical protein
MRVQKQWRKLEPFDPTAQDNIDYTYKNLNHSTEESTARVEE